MHLQVEGLIPDRIQVAIDGLGSLFGFAHLDSYVGIAGACFIFGL